MKRRNWICNFASISLPLGRSYVWRQLVSSRYTRTLCLAGGVYKMCIVTSRPSGPWDIQCKLPFRSILLKTATIHLQIHLGRQSRRHPSLPGSGNAKHLGKSASAVRRVINYLSGKEVIVTQHRFQYKHKRGTATKYSWQDEHGRIWREWTRLKERKRRRERFCLFTSFQFWMDAISQSPRERFESISCSTQTPVTDLFLKSCRTWSLPGLNRWSIYIQLKEK